MVSVKLRKLLKACICITTATLETACSQGQQEVQQTKFNRSTWVIRQDINHPDVDHPYRDGMLNDLVKNHQLKGLTYRQLVDSLGEPGNFSENDDTVRYEVIIGFESDIDPTYGKNLNLALGSDSVVTSYKISEWRHE